MTLKTTRLVRNMLGIGSTVCIGTFGFSLASSKSSITKIHALNTGLDGLKVDPQKITSVEGVEDLEYSRGCKFLFYKKTDNRTQFEQGDFDDARSSRNKSIDVVQTVIQNESKCVKGSYVFITSPDPSTTVTRPVSVA